MNTALQSVFLGTKPKRTVVCNQSSCYDRTSDTANAGARAKQRSTEQETKIRKFFHIILISRKINSFDAKINSFDTPDVSEQDKVLAVRGETT